MTEIHCLVFFMTILCLDLLDASECSWGVSKMYENYYKDYILHEPFAHHVTLHRKPQHAHNHVKSLRSSKKWTYEDQETWCNSYEDTSCCGTHQSPVRLTSNLKPVPMEAFEFINYTMLSTSVKIENNGQTALMGDAQARIRGGGLKHTYNLHAMNFHWGSEHVVNLIRAPLELQFVHYNSKFPDVFSAIASNEHDAMAIIAVFFWIGKDSTEALETVTSSLSTAGFKNAIGLIPPFDLRELLPETTTHFYRYNGSLTAPECSEVVVWTVFMEPNLISLIQLKKFYELKATEKGTPEENESAILHNYRKTQELYDRVITIGEETPQS